jgi:hypothetical protein
MSARHLASEGGRTTSTKKEVVEVAECVLDTLAGVRLVRTRREATG